MIIKKIGRLLVRRGLRSELPTDLADGQLAFAVDTGEVFVGAPHATSPSVSDVTNDGNIRFVSEIDQFVQVNTFTSLDLSPGANTVLSFPTNHDFAVFDFGLSYRDSGPYFAGSLKIFDTTVTGVPTLGSTVTFTVQKTGSVRTLRANNNGSRLINLTYQFRSWI